MENKYFIPDIEDFHIGYECEFKNNMQDNVWKKEICDMDLVSIAFSSWEHEDTDDKFSDNFRVSYLTKEQIEAEGWTKEKSYFIKNNIYLFFEDKFLVIDSGNPFSWEAIDSEILFKGKCKDINTFRKICKLLEI